MQNNKEEAVDPRSLPKNPLWIPNNTKGVEVLHQQLQTLAEVQKTEYKLTKYLLEQLSRSKCHFCQRYSPAELNTVVRRDPNKPYTLANVVPACRFCEVYIGVESTKHITWN